MASTVQCLGVISFNLDNAPVCSVPWTVVQAPEQFDPAQLDPAQLGQLYGIGFTVVAGPLILALGVRAFLNFIKTA